MRGCRLTIPGKKDSTQFENAKASKWQRWEPVFSHVNLLVQGAIDCFSEDPPKHRSKQTRILDFNIISLSLVCTTSSSGCESHDRSFAIVISAKKDYRSWSPMRAQSALTMAGILSSPDPLNDSPTFQSPDRTRRTSRVRHSLPLASSPTKQTFELDVGDQISPQKIRVTVEAGHSDTENGYIHYVEGAGVADTSPSRSRRNRRRERTVTTTIPVKGLSGSEDEPNDAIIPKRGRGRPRKSMGTPVPAKKAGRAGTPTRKVGRRRKSIGDLVDGDDEEDLDFRIGQGVQVGRGKGRSRSRSIKGTSQKSTPAAEYGEDRVVSSTTSKKGRGRGDDSLPEEVMALGDANEAMPEPENAEADEDGIPQPTHNESNPTSVPSSIRSITTLKSDDPDTVLARDPARETPQRTGWSSPRIIESTGTSRQALNGFPSSSVSPEKNESGGNAAVAHRSPEQYRPLDDENAGGQYEEEDQDDLDEMPDFDTILESEGFSMISVESVPSLRAHLSSPVNEPDSEISILRNKNLDSVKGSKAAGSDNPFSGIPNGIMKAATPAREPRNMNFLSIQNSRVDDSFSSVPSGVLDAATPARKTLVSLQSKRGSQVDGKSSAIAPKVLEAAAPARDRSKSNLLFPNNSQVYEDSFSAIPSAVLDAATPAPARHLSPKPWPGTAQTDIASNRPNFPMPNRPSSSQREISSIARLPTPDETPSPSADSPVSSALAQDKVQSEVFTTAPIKQLSANESSIHSQMRSSPPSIATRRCTYTAHLLQRRELNPDITQTPSIVFSSPSLPPPIHIARVQPALPVHTEEVARPGLSPIARAGRALQDAVGPTLSPRARSYSLGSPFKSPVADRKSSSSVAPSNSSLMQERQTDATLEPKVTGGFFPIPSKTARHHDDPFSNSDIVVEQAQPGARKQGYTLGLPEQHRLADPRLSTIRSEGSLVLSDDAMSWQAEEEVTADDATTSLVNNINSSSGLRGSSMQPNRVISEGISRTSEQKWAAERAGVCKQVKSADSSQVVVIDSDEECPDDAEAEREEDDEDFGLLLETLNSSSPAVEKPQVLAVDEVERPRRSKLPSPWRKNSKSLVYNDELSRLSPPPAHASEGLERNVASMDDDSLDLSSIIIPQKQNFNPRVRDGGNLDLSALLASSPNKSKLPVLTRSSQIKTSLAQEPSHSGTSIRAEQRRGGHQQPFAPISQKIGFNPRVRDPADADASSIFGSSPLKSNVYSNNIFGVHANKITVLDHPTPELSSSSTAPVPLSLSSPSRANSFRIPSQRKSDQPSESEYSFDSAMSPTSEEEKENRSIDKRTLKWTDTVRLASTQMPPAISPSKSCLRSPLKSPSNGSASGSNGTNTSPSKNVVFVSSSPVPSSPEAEPLSSTTWSRDHWLLLDSILQSWKPENNGGSEDGPKSRRRNSTRVISRLLGKRVSSQGEQMRLKQWHLEVVDEFRGVVQGWEEKVIAMRVFSLIVGEEHRRQGLVGRGAEAIEQSA